MLQEAAAYATEIDAVLQATGMRPSNRGQVRKIEEDNSLAGVSRDLKSLAEAMQKHEQRLNSQMSRNGGQQQTVRRDQGEVKCYNCGKLGHMRRERPEANMEGRAARSFPGHAALPPLMVLYIKLFLKWSVLIIGMWYNCMNLVLCDGYRTVKCIYFRNGGAEGFAHIFT